MRPLLIAATLLVAAGCDTGSGFGPPVAAEVLRVTVTAAPLADPLGDGWDGGGGGGPEVYFRLFDDAVDYRTDPGDDRLNPRDDRDIVFPLGSAEPWFEDVETLDFPLVWDVDPGYFVRDLRAPLYVGLFDYDPTTGDDPMGATESVRLIDAAPARASDDAVIIRLEGFDRNDDPTVALRVSLTVRFLD